jgi:thiol-disulfide isomerase/thioredoxin
MKFIILLAASIFSVTTQAQIKVQPAKEILAAAYTKAKKENKNVILIFHASWCGLCKKMDASMQDEKCKDFFDKNYVTIHLTVEESKENKHLENPGGDQVRIKYLGDKAGLPFWVVLDKEGNLLGDSFIRKEGVAANQAGENIGCPASEEEVAAFIAIIKKTSSLTQQELEIISKRFSENKVPASK